MYRKVLMNLIARKWSGLNLKNIKMIELVSTVSGGIDLLAQADFSMDNLKGILGGILGIIVTLGFIACVSKIIFIYFMGRQQGGVDMSELWPFLIGIIVLVIMGIIWTAVFGADFVIDPSSDGFDDLDAG